MKSAHREKVRTLSLGTLDCGGRDGVVAKPAFAFDSEYPPFCVHRALVEALARSVEQRQPL